MKIPHYVVFVVLLYAPDFHVYRLTHTRTILCVCVSFAIEIQLLVSFLCPKRSTTTHKEHERTKLFAQAIVCVCVSEHFELYIW